MKNNSNHLRKKKDFGILNKDVIKDENKVIKNGTTVIIEKDMGDRYFVSIPYKDNMVYTKLCKNQLSIVNNNWQKNNIENELINNGLNEVLLYVL